MKANLKNILGLAALGMTLLATTVPTWAGIVTNVGGVFIYSDQVSRYAMGSLVGVRYYSGDNSQNIGCIASILPSSSLTTCYATDGEGKSLYCVSDHPRLHEALAGMTDSSRLTFRMDPNGSTCWDIEVYHGSDMLR
jgi:hypothetical protein